MLYFKNVELAKLYAISEGTVRRWIAATKSGELDLQLYEHNSMVHVANTTKNKTIMDALVAKGKKHANGRWRKTITPSEEFYKLYDKRQVVDIISHIDIHREVPVQYDYFSEGADFWNSYMERMRAEAKGNTLTATVELLESNFSNLDRLLEGYEKVNVIDIGVANGYPVKGLLTHFLYDNPILNRYIGIDISKQMLDATEQNVRDWFEGSVNFEGHVRDISYQRFDDLLIEEDPATTLNLVLLFGGTINNFRSPDEVLRVIYHSMGKNSLFITSRKLDSSAARRYFDFYAESSLPRLPLYLELMLKRLNLDESFYEVRRGYNEKMRARYIGIELKVDLTFDFIVSGAHRYVSLNRGDMLLLWRAWHQTSQEAITQLDNNGFLLCEASASQDQKFLLTIHQINSNHISLGDA